MELLSVNQHVGADQIVESRSAIRRENKRQEKQKNNQEPVRRHSVFIVWGTILVALLMTALILNQTILSSKFVKHEITHSNLSETLMDNVNSGLSRYGVSTGAVSEHEANKLITQAVDQVYSGESIDLNLQPVLGDLNNSVSQAASQYGITGQLPSSVESNINSGISNTVNQQLNTPQVKQFTGAISIAKTVVHFIMLVSSIGLILMLLTSILKKHVIRSFSWIALWSSILLYGIILGLRGVVTAIGAHYPDYSSFTAQLATDFYSRSTNYWLILLILTIALFCWRITIKVFRGR